MAEVEEEGTLPFLYRQKTEIPSHGDNGQMYSVQSFLIIYLNPKLAYALIFVKKNLRLLDQNVKNKCKANDAQYT